MNKYTFERSVTQWQKVEVYAATLEDAEVVANELHDPRTNVTYLLDEEVDGLRFIDVEEDAD